MSILKLKTVLTTWQEQSLPSLSLDDMLDSTGLSHRQFRKYLRQQGEQMYKPTPGLIQEIHYQDLPYNQAKSMYYLSESDAYKVFYQTSTTNKLVNELEICELINESVPGIDIAQKYGISQARVSQIKAKHNLTSPRKKRTTLSQEQKDELIHLVQSGQASVKAAAERFDIGIATAYRIMK